MAGFGSILAGGVGGGLSGSSSAASRTGSVTTGGFTFAPKSSPVPPYVWLIAGAFALALLWRR